MQILVVEDDLIAGEMLSEVLRDCGHEVTLLHDGAAALACMHTTPFPLIISDWDMPVMNGMDLCKAVRSAEWGTYVYFILLTGRDDKASNLQGLSSGADDFLSKPFDPDELLARVRVAERILQLEMQDVTVFALAKLAESRDTDTGKHVERVQQYCRVLAEKMRELGTWPLVDTGFVRLLQQTAPLHDIGKVGIPDSVLQKPGKLTAAEFAVMKRHSALGAETLAAAASQRPRIGYLEMARQIARSHHERWDGTGYPDNLVGEAIPLAARIVAIADVYDALTSRRAYKDAYNHETAKKILAESSGTHFDPQLVGIFSMVEKEFDRIRGSLEEQPTRSTPVAA